MATVIGIYMHHYQERFGFKLIPTYTGRGFLSNLIAYSRALVMVIQACLLACQPLFHIHIAIGGSCFRKISLAAICRCFHKPYIMHIHAASSTAGSSISILCCAGTLSSFEQLSQNSDHCQVLEKEYASILDPQKLTMIYNPCPYGRKTWPSGKMSSPFSCLPVSCARPRGSRPGRCR
jgi:hypothetical protein